MGWFRCSNEKRAIPSQSIRHLDVPYERGIKMKKLISVLLAVCILVSVMAIGVSAVEPRALRTCQVSGGSLYKENSTSSIKLGTFYVGDTFNTSSGVNDEWYFGSTVAGTKFEAVYGHKTGYVQSRYFLVA